MSNPVILVGDGTTYEESALEEWLSENNTSPLTGLSLPTKEYKPNYALKQAILILNQQRQHKAKIDDLRKAVEAKKLQIDKHFPNRFNPLQASFGVDEKVESEEELETNSTTTPPTDTNRIESPVLTTAVSESVNGMIEFLKTFELSNAHIRAILKQRFESMDDLQRLTFPDCVAMNIPICPARKLLSRLDQLRNERDIALSPQNVGDAWEDIPIQSTLRTHLTSHKPTNHNSESDVPLTVNLLLLGNVNVGKTSLRKRLEFDEFTPTVPTVGMETTVVYATNRYRNYTIQVLMQDPSGMERYASVTRSFFRNVHAAILIFSAIEPESFYKGIQFWIHQLTEYGPDDIEMVLVCNKIDGLMEEEEAKGNKAKRRQSSVNDSSQVSPDKLLRDAVQFATRKQLSFYTTSAKSGESVRQCFEDVVSYVLQNEGIYERLQEAHQEQTERNRDVANFDRVDRPNNCRC